MSSPKEWDVKMSNINLTAAVRQNLLSLQSTAQMMAKTQNTLSTGNKVNSALDNPSNFFTASSLNSRASDLGNLMDSMKSGIKTIEAADNGLTSITKTLESMQSTLRQARQDKTFETASYTLGTATNYATDKLTFTGGAFGTSGGSGTVKLMTDSAQTATTTANYTGPTASNKATVTSAGGATLAVGEGGAIRLTYGTDTLDVTLADGDTSAQVATKIQAAIDADSTFKGKLAVTQTGGNFTFAATSAEDKTLSIADAPLNGNGTAAAAFGTLTTTNAVGSDGQDKFTINGVDVTLDATTSTDLATSVANINIQLGNAGSKFKAVASGSKLAIQANDSTAGDLKITGTDASKFAAAIDDTSLHYAKTTDQLVNEINNSTSLGTKIKASNDNGKLRIQNLSTQDLNVDGVDSSGTIDGTSTGVSAIGGNTVRSGLADQFNVLRDQLDKLADDASFNGINLLRGDKLKITFNETGTSSIDIQVPGGKSVDTTQLGLPTTMLAKDLDADTSIDSLLDTVKTALNQVRSQASTFGSNLSVVENRQDFTKKMMNTLQTGASNLTLADMNEEAANMVALQTRQSLATSSLSMANQADQNVLQLLR